MTTISCSRVDAFPLLPRSNVRYARAITLYQQRKGDTTTAKDRVNQLLDVVFDRAISNLSSSPTSPPSNGECSVDIDQPESKNPRNPLKASMETILDATFERTDSTLNTRAFRRSKTREESLSGSSLSKNRKNNQSNDKSRPIPRYQKNPAIVNTALAHVLWSHVLRPGIDTAIDATCGNGHDSVALAKLLFPPPPPIAGSDGDNQHCDEDVENVSRLVCMDVQARACEATRLALSKEYASLLEGGQIKVLHTSHSPLPNEWAIDEHCLSSVALVVYNLGWLPSNTDGTKEYITQMGTTLQSIVDAMLLLRIGGMISVVTYPKTNSDEDLAVRTFLECASLMSSNILTWEEFLKHHLELPSVQDGMTTTIRSSIERLEKDGSPEQTWRVSEHRKLGMDRAPILLIATRIK